MKKLLFAVFLALLPSDRVAAFVPQHDLTSSSAKSSRIVASAGASLNHNNNDPPPPPEPHPRSRDSDPKLKYLAGSLLAGSDLMYAFASLRKRVISNDLRPDGDPEKVDLVRPELIITQKHRELIEEKRASRRYLKHEVTGPAVQSFIESNMDFVKSLPNDEVNTEDGAVDNVISILERLKDVNFGFVEFDDQFANKELVYGIAINRTNKRVTVFFRGSTSGGRDWPTNFNAFRRRLDTPQEIRGEFDDKINVHAGFSSYLNERLEKKTGRGLNPWRKAQDFFFPQDADKIYTKFDEIEDNLRYWLSKPEYMDYSVYCSGHSLGGALSQLLAYQLAGNAVLKDFENACPVTAITYASPLVGDNGFNKAYQRLEKRGLLRHVRVSNGGDMVPVSVPGFGYTQTGLNLLVTEESAMQVSYRNVKTFLFTLSYAWKHRTGWTKLPGDVAGHHTPEQYYTNLLNEQNDQILKMNSVEELYHEHAGSFTD